MSLDAIIKETVESYNRDVDGTTIPKLSVKQDSNSLISTMTLLVLPEVDELYDWPCAMDSFSKVVSAGYDNASVVGYSIFRPVICYSSTQEEPLVFYAVTDFEERSAAYGRSSSNSYPTDYTIGANKIYIGPGVMAADTTISGKVLRRLTVNDVDYLPPQLLIYGLLKARHKKGTQASIAAWNGWNVAKGSAANLANKKTAESRTIRKIDPRISGMNRYINSL